MKLGTEIKDGNLVATVFNQKDVPIGWTGAHPNDVEVSAKYAHAYQQAMDEASTEKPKFVGWIRRRADEIMREWGYDDAGQGAEVK